MTKSIVVIFFFLFIACNNTNINNKVLEGENKSIKIDTSGKDDFRFNKSSDIRILSLYKEYDSSSSTYKESTSDISMKDYNNWYLNKENISDIIKSSKKISGTELDLSYLVLPFWYKGEFLMNNIKGNFKINAASFTILIFKDTSMYLGSSLKSKYKYFLVHPDTE